MIPRRLLLRNAIGIKKGIGKDEIDIDFTRFKSGIIGILGPTGCGKTTIIENMTPYRQLITRSGAIYRQFFDQGMKIFEFEMDGKIYESKILIDTKKRKMVPTLSLNGQILTDKSESYDAYIKDLIGDFNLFINSVFNPQKNDSIITSKDSDLKKLFVYLFQLDRYEKNFIPAIKKILTETENKITVTKLVYDEIAKDIQELKSLNDDFKNLKDEIPDLEKDLEFAQNSYREHIKKITAGEKALSTAESQLESLRGLKKELDIIRYDITQLTGSAAEDAEEIEKMIKSNLNEKNEAENEIGEINKNIKRSEKLINNKDLIVEKFQRLKELKESQTKISLNLNDLNNLKTEQNNILAEKNEKEVELNVLNTKVESFNKNISVLNEVPCINTEFSKKCPLLKNAHDSKIKSADLLRKLPQIKSDIENLDFRQRSVCSSIEKLKKDEGIEQINNEISELEKDDWGRIFHELENANKNIDQYKIHYQKTLDRIKKCDLINIELSNKLKNVALKFEKRIAVKKVRKSEIESEISEKEKSANIVGIKSELDSLKFLNHKYEITLNESRDKLTSTLSKIEEIEKQIKMLERKKKSLKDKESELNFLINDFEEDKIILKAFKDIPTLLLESLGIITTDHVNQLLKNVFDYDLSVKIITSLPKVSDGIKDVFKIIIYNNGDEVFAEDLSGGQIDMVDSAFRMGIELTLNEVSSIKYYSSFWDESDQSVDMIRALKFLEMLETARRLGNKYFTFLISHRTEIQNQLDQIINVEML